MAVVLPELRPHCREGACSAGLGALIFEGTAWPSQNVRTGGSEHAQLCLTWPRADTCSVRSTRPGVGLWQAAPIAQGPKCISASKFSRFWQQQEAAKECFSRFSLCQNHIKMQISQISSVKISPNSVGLLRPQSLPFTSFLADSKAPKSLRTPAHMS